MKQFNVPTGYRSSLISAIKQYRKDADKLKKDFTPTLLKLGDLDIYLARHFGFCYGVENAIEIAFRTIEENPGKRIFLLSEMIHNPQVNEDLLARGVKFLQDTNGKTLIPLDTLTNEDVVIIPAFGTTLDMEATLAEKGISTEKYNTTCPFVEKVWNRSEQIAQKGYSIVVHGKPKHEETRATFSHASYHTPTVVVNDMEETIALAKYITGEKEAEAFYKEFEGRYSPNFDIHKDLAKIGVVNQTTMLASETQAITDYLRNCYIQLHGEDAIKNHMADTRDTLCYATNDNQSATLGLLEQDADLAVVVGGYNSSNTSHLVELLEQKFPTYYIKDATEISGTHIQHFNYHHKEMKQTADFMPSKTKIRIVLTSGASCPDSIVEQVMYTLLSTRYSAKEQDALISNIA